MGFRPAVSLRSKFILIVLGGAVLPLALLGVWLNQTAERSGEHLLRARLHSSLSEIVDGIGLRWLSRRSQLLRLAESPWVQEALGSGGDGPPSHPDPSILQWAERAVRRRGSRCFIGGIERLGRRALVESGHRTRGSSGTLPFRSGPDRAGPHLRVRNRKPSRDLGSPGAAGQPHPRGCELGWREWICPGRVGSFHWGLPPSPYPSIRLSSPGKILSGGRSRGLPCTESFSSLP